MIPTNRMCFFIFGCAGSLLLLCGLSIVAATLHCSMQASHCGGFSCCDAQVQRHMGFSSCGTQARQSQLEGSRVQAQQLWRMGLVAPPHVESSRTRDQIHVPCIGREILSCLILYNIKSLKVLGYILRCMHTQSLSGVLFLATPWTGACLPPVLGIFQARILEWVATSSSRGSPQSTSPAFAGGFFDHLAKWEAPHLKVYKNKLFLGKNFKLTN